MPSVIEYPTPPSFSSAFIPSHDRMTDFTQQIRRAGWVLLLTVAFANGVSGQVVLDSTAQISVITVQPGDPIYTLFGHTAIRVVDETRDMDVSFNYGTFDYGDPLFVPKFIQGELIYFLSAVPFPAALRHYSLVENRSIVEQHLNLTMDQRQVVFDFLATNLKPENRDYRYDFLYDNCSTRVLDVLASTLNLTLPPGDSAQTFRDLLNPYIRSRPVVKTGIDLGLGFEVEKIPSARQTSFLPDELMSLLALAEIGDSQSTKLVSRTDTLFVAQSQEKPIPWIAVVGWAILIILAIRLWMAAKTNRISNIFDVVMLSVAGLAGFLILHMWFFTQHTVTALNANLLWAFPGHLVVAFMFARSKLTARQLKTYCLLTGVLVTVFVLLAVTRVYVSWLLVPWALVTIVNAARLFVSKNRTA